MYETPEQKQEQQIKQEKLLDQFIKQLHVHLKRRRKTAAQKHRRNMRAHEEIL